MVSWEEDKQEGGQGDCSEGDQEEDYLEGDLQEHHQDLQEQHDHEED